MMNARSLASRGLILLTATLLAGCGGDGASTGGDAKQAGGTGRVRTLTLGAYTTPREVYGQRIIPAFQKYWRETRGEEVRFQESYLGSGAQARAIVGGFEADVAALSLEPDIQTLADARLITHDWKAGPHAGMVTRSVVVLGVRKGNPRNVRTWDDLGRADVSVLTPNPRTSGGAMWNIAALYGAALRGHTRAPAGDQAAAEQLLAGVLGRVKIMDKGARESMLTFESGTGDAIISYENEMLVARKAGQAVDYVVPPSTILIENPVAVVDVYADRHGVRDVADAFVAFLATPEVQRMYAEYGLRPVDQTVGAQVAGQFAPTADLFTIRDLGGWPGATKTLFERGAAFDRATSRAAGR